MSKAKTTPARQWTLAPQEEQALRQLLEAGLVKLGGAGAKAYVILTERLDAAPTVQVPVAE